MLASDNLSAEERERCTKALLQASKRLNDLVSNILKMNKLENQKIKPDAARFCLSDQLAEIIIGYEELFESKEIEFECNIDEAFVYSCPSYLEIVWSNLLSNAIKFTENGGKISVALHADGHNATVTVTDTGCGIDSETGKHIFDRFYQGDTSRKSQGNGLGLALVKKVIDVLGGEISVQSEVGKGSTFTIVLKDVINE
jgi:signal transduction histidine kinase